MIINDVVLQNQNLSSQMKAYSDEIEKADRLRDMIRQKSGPKNQYAHLLSVKLKRIIANARDEFELINDMYDQKTHDSEEVRANGGSGFIFLARSGSERLQNIFAEIKKSKMKIHKTVVEYCHLIESESNN